MSDGDDVIIITLQEDNMSLNTAHANGGVLIYSGERILIYYDGIKVQFDMTCNMPHFKGNKEGRIYLTTHRVIFNNKSSKDTLQSFSMPFYCMREVELEQPIFGANYIKGKVRAEAGGNWEGDGKFKLHFNHGGAIEFGQCMLQAGKMASRHTPSQPPPYTPPSGPYYQAPPPAYAPPAGPQYGFVPYQVFPNAPPADAVFMTEAPPPYPGIDPNLGPYPPPQMNGYGANGYGAPPMPQDSAAAAKAAEAAGSAYYNPANPHNVYMPQGYPGEAPPPYSEPDKKNK